MFLKNGIIFFLIISFSFSEPFQGLTLISDSSDNPETHLIDNDFTIINTWTHDTALSGIAYLTNDSILYASCRINNNQGPKYFKKMNWDNQIIWEYALHDTICRPHHDIEILPNGNILSICGVRKSNEELNNIGMIIDEPTAETNRPNFDSVIELEPIGSDEANIVWEWHFWDHLIQDVDSDLPNYGIVSDNPQLLDINSPSFNDGAPGDDADDWLHCNSIHYHPTLDQIVLSSRHRSELYVIDHSTTTLEAASSEGGLYGKGGDFLYRWGNPQNYHRGTISDQILKGQHSVNWIPINYPGAGNLILFNNMHNTLENSAVLEIIPPINDNGIYEIDEVNPFNPISYNWIYQNNFYSLTRSGAFRLPNGNTIITVFEAQTFEIDSLNQVVWNYNEELVPARVLKYPYEYLESILGDINEDYSTDVLDVVLLVNIILGILDIVPGSDINGDGTVNTLDVVQLINLILNP